MKTLTPAVTLNHEQGLYVIPSGSGYSCLGFQVLENRMEALTSELVSLGYPVDPSLTPATLERYLQYQDCLGVVKAHYNATGYRFKCELTPQLSGLESRRVEVVDCYGDTRRFIVGKSTGWMPCHLEIARRNSSGGGAVYGAPFSSVRVLS